MSAILYTAITDYWTPQLFTPGESNIPRFNVGTSPVLVNGTVTLSYWTAVRTEVCNNITTISASTAAGATPTFCGMAVYQANSDGSLTLLAQCANDTTLWAGAFTTYTRALTSPFNKITGARYALANLCITAAATPNLSGFNGTVVRGNANNRLVGAVSGQASFPSTVLSGNIGGTGSFYYGDVTP